MVVAKTLDYTQAEEEITSLTLSVRGDPLLPAPAFPVKSFFHKNLVASQNVFVKELEKKGHTLGIRQQGGQSGRSPTALSYEQIGSCVFFIENNMEFARKKAWDLHNNFHKVKGTNVQAC